MCMFGEVLTSVLFCSVHQLYAINPARMEVIAPNQIPALVLEDGVGLHAMKVCGIFQDALTYAHMHKGQSPKETLLVTVHHSTAPQPLTLSF